MRQLRLIRCDQRKQGGND